VVPASAVANSLESATKPELKPAVGWKLLKLRAESQLKRPQDATISGWKRGADSGERAG